MQDGAGSSRITHSALSQASCAPAGLGRMEPAPGQQEALSPRSLVSSEAALKAKLPLVFPGIKCFNTPAALA